MSNFMLTSVAVIYMSTFLLFTNQEVDILDVKALVPEARGRYTLCFHIYATTYSPLIKYLWLSRSTCHLCLSWTLVSRSCMQQPVHSFILGSQFFLCLPWHQPPSNPDSMETFLKCYLHVFRSKESKIKFLKCFHMFPWYQGSCQFNVLRWSFWCANPSSSCGH